MTAMKKHGLGRGLDALIRDGSRSATENTSPQATPAPSAPAAAPVTRVPTASVRPNPHQPRKVFDETALAELAESVKANGILQPILVRVAGNGYELITGERRLRAAQQAGLKDIPVVVMTAAPNRSLELTLIENLHRSDLNAIEQAAGFQELADSFGYTQEQIAERAGIARASVANLMRLLSLPMEIREMVLSSRLTAGHAKALSGLPTPEEQLLFARRAIKEDMSVRNLEKAVQKATRPRRKPRASRDDMPPAHVAHLSDKLHGHFGTGVRLYPSRTLANGKKARGIIEIEFYSNDDLHRILEIVGVSAD